MSDLALEIFIIFLLLVANGVFAASEIAIVAVRKARLQKLAEAGNSQAQTTLELAENPNQLLATVQVGITLIGVMAGAFGGATLAENIATYISLFPPLAPYSDLIGIGVVVIFITYFSLIIGELVPKRLALNNPERTALLTAPWMQLVARAALPVVHLLDMSTNLMLRLVGAKPSEEPPITLEEIKVLIEQGTESGIIEATEQDMIENILLLDERPVVMCMTPRTQIVWFDIDEDPKELQRKVVDYHHSRFPVAQDNLDNIVGFVKAKELLVQSLTHQTLDLKELLHSPLFIPESMSALEALETLKEHGTHMALVMDEYGGVEGLVTTNNILDDIVGYIPTRGEPSTEPEAHQREDGSWLVDGLLDIHSLKEVLKIAQLPNEEDRGYHTVGGLMISQVRGIPTTGHFFEWENLRFEVVDMDRQRVDKVLVTPLKQ